MLKVEDLRFRYHGCAPTLRGVDFTLCSGRFLAILGNNGAGKSTMLKCFDRILTPESGRVELNGEDLLRLPHREVARRVAFVSQTPPDARMTVHDTVMLGRRPYMRWDFTQEDHRIVHAAMDRLGVGELRGRFLDQLSGGERQKVMLSRALAQQPSLLLLDEPTSSLDLQNQYQVLETVRSICAEDGITAVMVIHDLNLALRFCDAFLLLKDGVVYRFGGDEILCRGSIRAIYGVDAQVVPVGKHKMILVD